jgi:hypothetical protein
LNVTLDVPNVGFNRGGKVQKMNALSILTMRLDRAL